MNIEQNFDNWHKIKKKLQSKEIIKFRQGEIYFMSIGQNIGYESFGKKELFLRPILVYKKLSKETFVGIPLTSKIKEGNYYFQFSFKKDKISTAMLNQIRVFDIRRHSYFYGKIKFNDLRILEDKLNSLLKITSQKGKFGHSHDELSKYEGSISQKDKFVNSKSNQNKVFIIAEAGVNHNGSIELAKKLIDVASESGADAVKFQTFKASNLVSRDAQKADYQKKNMTDNDDSQFTMLKKLELDIDTHKELISYCQTKNIMFLSTPFDHDSIKLLDSLDMKIWKIPSGEITNLPYLREIGKLNKEIIISTGMANMSEIEDALNVLIQAGTSKGNITVLHANTMYPTPMEDVNLRAMLTIGDKFDIKYGYSDHTLGIEVPISAVSLGASVIEKHFTLDKTMSGPDHKASLEPSELKAMVKSIRNIEIALGSYEKKPSPSETPNIKVVRKSIVASCDIHKGDILTDDNLTVKRPSGGINPMKWDKVIGTIADKDYKEDELI